MDFSQLSGGQMAMGVIGAIIAILIVALVLALVLGVINLIINRFWPHYGRTYGAVVLTLIVAGIINYIIGKGLGADRFWAGLVIGIIVTTLVGGFFFGTFVRREDESPLGFKGAVVPYLILAILLALLSWGLRPWQQARLAKMHEAAAPAAAMSAPPAASTAPTMSAPMAAPETATSAPTPAASAPASGSTSG